MKRLLIALALGLFFPSFTAECTMTYIPQTVELSAAHTPEEQFLLDMTACTYGSQHGDTVDITGDFPEKSTWNIPEDAQRGYVFRISLQEDSPFSPQELCTSVEQFAPDLPFAHPVGQIQSLRQLGRTAPQEGETLYIDMTGFWGTDGGWQDVTSRKQFRDPAMPVGMAEQFVSPQYLYETYLCPGSPYSFQSSRFLGQSGQAEDAPAFYAAEDGVILILSQPTVGALVDAKLADVVLQHADGSTEGAYRVESRSESQLVLVANRNWRGERPYRAPVITCTCEP